MPFGGCDAVSITAMKKKSNAKSEIVGVRVSSRAAQVGRDGPIASSDDVLATKNTKSTKVGRAVSMKPPVDGVSHAKSANAGRTRSSASMNKSFVDDGEIQSQHDSVLLQCGDSLDVLAKIEGGSVDLILTDPPYNLGLFMKKRGTNIGKLRSNHFVVASWDLLDFEEWTKKMDAFFSQAARILRKRGAVLMFMSIIKLETVKQLAEKHGFYYKTIGIWHKTNPMPRNMNLHFVNSTESWIYLVNGATTGTFNNNGKIIHDFFETAAVRGAERKCGVHPTQKPLVLMEHFVSLLSNGGDLVIDPFMGSGTTGVACKNLGRRFIGIDVSPEYCEIARRRIFE